MLAHLGDLHLQQRHDVGKLPEHVHDLMRVRLASAPHHAAVACAPQRQQWAAAICLNAEKHGIMQQPSNLLDEASVADYKRQLARSGDGTPPHVVVFRLMDNNVATAQQLLDFPIKASADVQTNQEFEPSEGVGPSVTN